MAFPFYSNWSKYCRSGSHQTKEFAPTSTTWSNRNLRAEPLNGHLTRGFRYLAGEVAINFTLSVQKNAYWHVPYPR